MRLSSLGADVKEWVWQNGYTAVAVISVKRPSATTFSVESVQNLIEHGTNLKELHIKNAAGMRGIMCGSNSSSNGIDDNDAAIDQNTGEEIGPSQIRESLTRFKSNSTEFYSEFGFPPTLNRHQRKLVHTIAEEMGFDHESIGLKNNNKIVKVRLLGGRRDNDSDAEEEGASSSEEEGASSSSSEEEQQQQQQQQHQQQQHQSLVNFDPAESGVFDFEVDFVDDDDDDAKCSPNSTSNPNLSFDETNLAPISSPQPVTPLSKRQQRLLTKSKRKKEKKREAGEFVVSSDSENEKRKSKKEMKQKLQNQQIDDAITLQCSTAQIENLEPKVLRKYKSLAHQLPTDDNQTPICLKSLRNICSNRDCALAHFQISKTNEKRFLSLVNFVCELGDDFDFDRRESRNDRSNGENHSRSPGGGGKSPGKSPSSYGSDDGGELMDRHVNNNTAYHSNSNRATHNSVNKNHQHPNSGRKGNKTAKNKTIKGLKNRKNLFNSENLAVGEELSATLSTFSLQNLQCLSLIYVPTSGASLSGSCLRTLVLKGCSNLSFLNLNLPLLQCLDLTDCGRLNTLSYGEDSMKQLVSCVFTGCRLIREPVIVRLVARCKWLKNIHLFGSGCVQAPKKGGRTAQFGRRIKTKKNSGFLEKLSSVNRELEVVTTKRGNKLMNSREIDSDGSEESEEEEQRV